ncbi:MAG TPA: zinc ribbon domain-containing protein [candidate division Zixibacteria bacterium]|nr:zinc ribbon domain-containing protein [candidate division Zixibacteria bacterium]
MNGKYCINCGSSLNTEDKFCHLCGARAENVKTISQQPKQYEGNNVYEVEIDKKTTSLPRKKLSKNAIRAIIIVPLVLSIIALPFVAVSIIGSISVPLGTLEYEVTSLDILETKLVIDNSVGSVTINYDDSISNLFEASLIVKGGLAASLDNAVNFEHQILNNQTIITFDSGEWFESFWTMKQLNYKIIISLNPSAIVDFAITTSTGSSALLLNGIDNIIIHDLFLDSSTGSVGVYSGNTINTTIDDISLTTSTGSVTLDFNKAINTKIQDLFLDCSTGRVYANLGENMEINSEEVIMSTSTGSVTLEYENIILNNDINWDVSTSTGSITINFNQDIIIPANFTANFDVETSTGSISINCITHSDLGIEMLADTNTGSINLPGGFSHFISTDCYLKNNIYNFILITSTGSITAVVTN